MERTLFQHHLVERLHRPEVVNGHWITTYHHDYPEWLPVEKLAQVHEGVFETALSAINPIPHWKPEALYISSQQPISFLEVIMHAEGAPPMSSPLIGKPALDHKKIFYEIY